MRRFGAVKIKRIVALILAGLQLTGLCACNDKENTDAGEKTYTLKTCISQFPFSWNPLTREEGEKNIYGDLCEMGFVSRNISDDGNSYEYTYEMASDIKDITGEYSKRDFYGISDDKGRVFKIQLNSDAVWEDGQKIKAADYVKSMEYCLDPSKSYKRAVEYTDGKAAVLNAKEYYENKPGEIRYMSAVKYADKSTDGILYYNYDNTDTELSLNVCQYEDYADEYSCIKNLMSYKGKGYVAVDDTIKDNLSKFMALLEKKGEDDYKNLCFVNTGVYEDMTFDNVGIYAEDEYSLIYITRSPMEMEEFLYAMTDNWLVKEEYGESVKKYISYGPYKPVSVKKDSLTFERNSKWYGYKDDSHKGQYQTTNIQVTVADENKIKELIKNGDIDFAYIDSNDTVSGIEDRNLISLQNTTTYKWSFVTDINVLKALEKEAGNNINKAVLAYDDFRQAIAYSINREEMAMTGTENCKGTDYLLSNGYFMYDNGTYVSYRNDEDIKNVSQGIYENGYDVTKAQEFFNRAYSVAVTDGNYTDGQNVVIRCECTSDKELSDYDKKQMELMNKYVSEASKGTGFEGKISFEFVCADDRYEDIAGGRIEMIKSSWSGNALNPEKLMRVYTDTEYMGGLGNIHESCGFNPANVNLDITFDFNGDGENETVSTTYEKWARSINKSGEYENNFRVKKVILANMEASLLSLCRTIPWGVENIYCYHSKRINTGFTEYSPYQGFQCVRKITYKRSDI